MIYYANNHCLIIDRLFAGVRGNLTQLTVSGVGVQTKAFTGYVRKCNRPCNGRVAVGPPFIVHVTR
jgi:hypothetical protein